ncbi:MAG: hypothetical protein ACOVRM_09950 [Planctomycetaceae bacterium]
MKSQIRPDFACNSLNWFDWRVPGEENAEVPYRSFEDSTVLEYFS